MNAVLNLQVIASSRRATSVIQSTQRQVQGLNRSMTAATASATRMNAAMRMRNMDRFAKDLQWVGRQIEFNFTLPLLLAGGFATSWALENERAMTRVRKVYDVAGATSSELASDLDSLGESFRLLSDRFGVHQDEVAGIGASWAQAGASGAALANATRLTMETMILGDFSGEDAVTNLIAIQQQYQLAVEDSADGTLGLRGAMAQLNAIENTTAVSFADLTTVLQDAGGIARGAGVPIRELGAAAASLVPAAADASEAGNGLKTMIARLMAPTTQANSALQAIGINTQESAWASKTFSERLQEVAGSLDDVSNAQAITALKHIAGIRQVSRLQVLLNDLTDEEGKYATALRATADQQAANQRYQDELRAYLQSSPQQVKILTTQMKNLAIEGIQPLIPYMLELLASFRNLMKAFIELPPNTQRIIFYLLLLIATIGPAMRILGAFGLLFLRVGMFARGFAKAVAFTSKAVVGAFAFMGKGVLGFFGFFGTMLRGGVAMVARFATATVATVKFLALAMVGGISAASSFVGKALPAFVLTFSKFAVKAYAVWTRMFAALALATKVGFQFLFLGIRTGFRGLALLFTGGLKKLALIAARGFFMVFTSPLGLALLAAVGLVYLFRDEISGLIQDLINAWGALPEGVVGALRAMINVVKQAALAVYEWLQWMNPFARHSPSLVENVKAGVAIIASEYGSLSNIGTSFGKAIKDMQAFGRATAAAKAAARSSEFGEQRASVVAVAPAAGDEFDAVVSSIYGLERALAAIQVEYDAQARVVAEWESALTSANFELDAQQFILEGLQARAASLGEELSAAQDQMSSLASTPIEGMQAYSDAIFENQMAQQELRLEMLRIEETFGTVEGLRDRMAGLSGDIELLNGQRETLRAAGAGSDVLAALDSQITTLENERRALNDLDSGPMAEMAALEQQLADLQKQGEILDLERNIQFDPLTRQIDNLVNGMDEVPFDLLLADLTSTQAEVARLTQEYDAANAAVEAQQSVVNGLTAQRDAIEATYDMELAKLEQLGDSYDEIEDQISRMVDALAEFSALAATSGTGSGAGGANDILGPEGDFAIPTGAGASLTGGDIDALNAEWAAELEGLFDISIMDTIREQWDKALAYIKTKWTAFKDELQSRGIDLDAIASNLGAAFGNFWDDVVDRVKGLFGNIGSFDDVKDSLSGVMEALDPIITAFKEFWGIVKDFFVNTWEEIQRNFTMDWEDLGVFFQGIVNYFKYVIGLLIMAFTWIWPTVRNVMETVFDLIANIIGGVVQIFSGLIKFIGGVFTGDFDRIWAGLGDILSGAIEIIVSIVVAGFKLIGGFILGVGEGIVDVFRWLKDMTRDIWQGIVDWIVEKALWIWNWLVGNSLIPDLVNAIVGWWQKLKDWTAQKFEALRAAVVEIWQRIKDNLASKIESIRAVLSLIGGYITDKVTRPFEAMKNALAKIWESVATKVATVWNGIAAALNAAIQGVARGLESLVDMWNRAMDKLGGPTIKINFDIPNIPQVAVKSGGTSGGAKGGKVYAMATGGVINAPTMALMGEYSGVRGNPEIVTPERLMRQVFSDTLENFSGGGGRVLNFSGDLSFPNITNGDDAEEFVRNLEAMVD